MDAETWLTAEQFQSTPPARGATAPWRRRSWAWLFQSTPPARGATESAEVLRTYLDISIHAPREGGDSSP